MCASPDQCAHQVLESIPPLMQAIRNEMRRHRGPDLSVVHFRVLIFLNRHEGASLSAVSEHLGLTLPSVSKMIDGLVARNLVARRTDPADRRRVALALTLPGRAAMQSAHEAAQSSLAERLAALPASELTLVQKALQVLDSLFGTEQATEAAAAT